MSVKHYRILILAIIFLLSSCTQTDLAVEHTGIVNSCISHTSVDTVQKNYTLDIQLNRKHNKYNMVELEVRTVHENGNVSLSVEGSFETYRVDGNIQERIGGSSESTSDGLGKQYHTYTGERYQFRIDDIPYALTYDPKGEDNHIFSVEIESDD